MSCLFIKNTCWLQTLWHTVHRWRKTNRRLWCTLNYYPDVCLHAQWKNLLRPQGIWPQRKWMLPGYEPTHHDISKTRPCVRIHQYLTNLFLNKTQTNKSSGERLEFLRDGQIIITLMSSYRTNIHTHSEIQTRILNVWPAQDRMGQLKTAKCEPRSDLHESQ